MINEAMAAIFARDVAGSGEPWELVEGIQMFEGNYRPDRFPGCRSRSTEGERIRSWPESWPEWVVVALARGQGVVRVVAAGFWEWAVGGRPNRAGEKLDVEEDDMPLSVVECHRLWKAVYRFQLFCNLFRRRRRLIDDGTFSEDVPSDCVDPDGVDNLATSMIGMFQAWEVEGIVCVRDYMYSRYLTLFDALDLSFLLDPCLRNVDVLIECLMSLGLDVFVEFTRTDGTVPRRVELIELAVKTGVPLISRTFAVDARPGYIDDAIDDTEEGLVYVYDDLDYTDRNAVCTWKRRERHVEPRYFSPRRVGDRRWGYVMWDRERLARWGVYGPVGVTRTEAE